MAKVYKKVETPTPPPVTIHLELTPDEYETLREGSYWVWQAFEKNLHDVSHAQKLMTGDETLGAIGYRLYNDLPPTNGSMVTK